MSRGGWLEATRHGNRSYYRLSKHGRALIQEGSARIFRPRRDPWDGAWHLVTYSIPEAQRELRDHFRKRLSYLGFGLLAAGAWISPHDLRAEVAELADDLGVGDFVDQFRGAYLQRGECARALAARVWPLERLAEAYHAFAQRWGQVADEVADGVPNAQAFVLRFWLVHEYQRFFMEDPDLPRELLPASWPGRDVAHLFETLHDRLAPGANRFFEAVFEARHANGRERPLREREQARGRHLTASTGTVSPGRRLTRGLRRTSPSAELVRPSEDEEESRRLPRPAGRRQRQ
jgi:phenylacetic acid degradation operon negative regulatory protein